MPHVGFSHYGADCAFDYFLKKHQFTNPALHQLARIVRGADTDHRRVVGHLGPSEQPLDSLQQVLNRQGLDYQALRQHLDAAQQTALAAQRSRIRAAPYQARASDYPPCS